MISSTDSLSRNDSTARRTSSSTHGASAAAGANATAITTPNTTANTNNTAAAKARATTLSQAALQAAGSTHRAAVAEHALDRQQIALAGDLRAATRKAGVDLSGAVEFSVSSKGEVSLQGTDADKAAMTKFLNADRSKPSFATRIATQAKDALHLSASIRQNAAISQAARYGGKSGGVMSMYTSLMQSPATATAVFAVSATSSSLTYPGSLAATA